MKASIHLQRAAPIMLWVASLALIITLATSCQKCAECTITTTTQVTGQQPTTAYSNTRLCGSDLKEADGNTSTSTSTYQGVTATITSRTVCN